MNIRLREERVESVEVTYTIDESKIEKEAMDRIKTILASGQAMTKEQLNTLFNFCNANSIDTEVEDDDSCNFTYKPDEFIGYETE